MININQESVKELLLKLETCDTDFKVIFSGKKSNKVNGLYKQDINEIVIHNKNFKNDNELIYTAIHEYSHHLMWCKYHKIGKVPKHNNEFWSIMYNLIDLAEEKNLYKKYPDESVKKEIQNLVSSAKKINEEIASLYKKLGETISEIRKETDKHEIRIEDILIRECQLNKKTAEMAEKAYGYNIDSSLGQDLQQAVILERDNEKQTSIIEDIKNGKTIYQAKQNIKPNNPKLVRKQLYINQSSTAAEKVDKEKEAMTRGICLALGQINEGATVKEVLEMAEIDRREAIECKVPEIDIERLEDVFNEIKSSESENNKVIKENQSKEFNSLKPISKQAKKLLEKIIANQKLYPVVVKINKAKNTMTIRYDSSTPASFPEFVLLVKEFSYGKEYYPIQEIYFDYKGTIKKFSLLSDGYSFITNSKAQKQSTVHCRLMIEHINRKKISLK
ncbi:hypothetical protein E4N99_10205 [Treponema denticola]|uniref:hypothetical protein n=1 Tax=Treponema denticola TaxID=158 RepID=UPI0002B53BF8|nr:hypothetical protein [Treponema denticola]EMB37575.1 hypothetical protein HMPREF9722_02508 [Treponema denticola ATCC 33520]